MWKHCYNLYLLVIYWYNLYLLEWNIDTYYTCLFENIATIYICKSENIAAINIC